MEIPNDEAGENCSAKGAINLQIYPGRVSIRYGTPDPKDNWPVKYQNEYEQDEQAPSDQPGPSSGRLNACLGLFIHEGGNLFPRR